MGAHDIAEVIWTTKSAREAYDEAVADALHLYGYDSYSGSIATTNGVVEVNRPPMSTTAAHRLASGTLERLHKGGHCEAIPLLAEGSRRNLTVTVTTKDGEDVEAAIAKAAKLTKGESVASFWTTGAPSRTMRAPKVNVPKAKAVTTYSVVNSYDRTIAKGFETQAAARAKAVELASTGAVTEPMRIVAKVVRTTGESLLTVTPVVASTTQTYTVEVEAAPESKARAGWLFVGVAVS